MEQENIKKCIKCKSKFEYRLNDTWWNYKGYTPTKLVRCPECSCIQAVGYEEEINPNYDRRLYG